MRLILGLFVVVSAACAPTPPPVNGPPGATAQAGSGSNVVCHEETPTGSSISRTVCREVDPNSPLDEPGVMNTMQGPQQAKGKGQ